MRAITVLGMVWVAAALASTAAPAAGPVRGTGFAAESAVSFAFNDDPAVYAWLGTTRAVQATVTVTDAGDSSGTVTLAGDSTVTPSTLTFPENDSTPYSAQVTVTLPAASKTYHYTAAIMRATTGRVQDSDAATVAPSPYAAEFEPYHQGVALTTGAMHYAGGPDITIGNPLGGPGVTFERVYDSRYAKDGLSSPGLSVGWVHNYDTRILTRSDSAWGTVMLRFPDGAVTYLTPPTTITAGQVYDLTAYEGSTAYEGAPYRARGKASASAGQWEYLKLVYRDLSTWTFERLAASTYLPTQLTDGTSGLSIDFSWEDGGGRKRLHEIKAGGGTVTLFHATYGDGGLLSRVDDAILSRKVTYGVTTPQGSAVPCLESASQVQRSDLSAALLRCRYGYDTANANCPLLRTITECLPDTETEGAVSTATYVDDKVVEQTDANGHYTTYTYLSGMTKVERFDAASPNASLIEWTQKYDTANRDTGVIDSGGQETTITYDETHRHLPAMVTTKDQQTITYSYDPCGNLDETIELIDPENSRDLVTDYTYTSYPNFPCGLLTRVTQDNALEERTVVTTVYDQTTGLPVKTIAPAPALGEGVHWRPTQDVQASESATIPDTESMTDATLTAAGLHAVEACREQGRPLWLAFRATSGECPLYLSGTGITVNDVFYPATDDMLLYVADGSSYGQAVLGAGSGHGEVRVLLRFPDIGAGSVSSAYLTLGRTSSAGSVTFHAVVLASDPGEYPVNGRGKRLFDDIGNASETLDTTTVTSAYAYDAQNNLIWTRGPSDDPAQLAITQYEYGTVPGRVQSVIDALGASSQFRYYAASGLLDESEDASHCVTKRYYDYGRLSLLLEQDGRETAYTYNETAKMVTVTLPESNEFVPYHAATRTTLASWGGPATIEEVFDERADDEDPPFRVHETVYGAMGEMRVATTRRGIAYDEALRSEVEYDAAYRTRKVWQGGNTQPTEYVYTKKTATVHAKVTVTSPAGAVSVSELDTYDRPWQTTVRGQPTTRAYDGLGRPTTVTYPAPSETSVTATTHYDGWGRVDSVTRAQDEDSESTVVNGFDATDRPIATTHTRGNVSMTYGGTFTPAGSPFDRTRDTDVTKARYDVLGRPVLTVQPTGGALHRTYDNLGRLTHLRELPTEGTSPSTVSPTVFTYEDATNNRTRVQYPMYDDDEERGWPDFETTEYDGLDRVTKTTDALGTYKTYSYQYLGLPAGCPRSPSPPHSCSRGLAV